MAKKEFPPVMKATSYPLGKAKDNKPASVYAGRYKEGLTASADRPNKSKLDQYDVSLGNISKSAGDEQPKTSGIKIRGTGAATKGLMARGKMG